MHEHAHAPLPPDRPARPPGSARPAPRSRPRRTRGTGRTLNRPAAFPTLRSLQRLWPYVRPYRWKLGSASALAGLASLLALAMPQVIRAIIDGPVAEHHPRDTVLGGLALLLLGGAEASIFGIRRRLVATPLAAVEARMRADFHRHAQRLPIATHARWTSGQLLSRGTADPQAVHLFVAGPLTFLPVHLATLAAGAAILVYRQWLLALIVLAPVPLLILRSYRFESRYAQATRRAQDLSGDLTTAVLESVEGIRVIKGFRRSGQQVARFRDQVRRVRDAELDKARLLGGISAATTALPGLATAAALATGGVQAAHGPLTTGSLLAFLGTVAALRPAVEETGVLLAVCQDAAAAANRYVDVLGQPTVDDADVDAVVVDDADSADRVVDDPAVDAPVFEVGSDDPVAGEDGSGTAANAVSGPRVPRSRRARRPAELVFSKVRFGYPDARDGDRPALCGVDLRVAPGETLAVVGATGSGKTTLAPLTARLHDPAGGRITLDGVDIARIPRSELRSAVAVAFDEPVLFSGTVLDNVLLGEKADAAAIDHALRCAGVEEFLPLLADGVLTRVGEGGMTLSGGQRQRIALARIMVRRPRVVVLDDPLSAVDTHTEARVHGALRDVLAATTAVVMARRPSTVTLADRVAMLAEGRVVAVGTHDELLDADPAYAALMTPLEAAGDTWGSA